MGKKADALQARIDNTLRQADQAVSLGQLSREQGAALRGMLTGDEGGAAAPAAPVAPAARGDREVVIRLRVSGGSIPSGAGREVEGALRSLAQRAGVTITPGSVTVS